MAAGEPTVKTTAVPLAEVFNPAQLAVLDAFAAMRKDGNGLTHTQENVILQALR